MYCSFPQRDAVIEHHPRFHIVAFHSYMRSMAVIIRGLDARRTASMDMTWRCRRLDYR